MFFIEMLFAAAFLFSSDKEPVSLFVDKFCTEGNAVRELHYAYLAGDETAKIPRGKFDTYFYADFAYSDQDGAIGGNFSVDNILSKSFEAGLKKYWQYGLDTKLSHKYSGITASMPYFPAPQSGSIPVTSLSVSVPVLNNFFGVNDRREMRIIELKLAESSDTYADSREQLIYNALKLFLNTRFLKEQIKVAETLSGSAEQLLSVMKRKKKFGSTEERHYLWAESNSIDGKRGVEEAARAYRELLNKLASFSGFDPEPYVIQDLPSGFIPSVIAKVRDLELKNRELAALENQLNIAKEEEDTALNNKLPKLLLNGSVSAGGIGDNFNSAYSRWSEQGYFVGVNFIWDIANTGPGYALSASRLYMDSLDARLTYKKLEIDKNVATALNNIDSYDRQLEISEKSFAKLKRRYSLEWSAFRLGRSSMSDVVDAQNAMALSGIETVKIKYAILESVYLLAWLKGNLETFVR